MEWQNLIQNVIGSEAPSFFEGGLFMWLIFSVSFVGVSIALERYIRLQFTYGLNARHFFTQIQKYVDTNDFHRAREYCVQYEAPLAKILEAGLAYSKRQPGDMDIALESEALYQSPKITKRLNYLPTLANVATLMGLLGTISGLITAFQGLGEVEAGREEVLAMGISVAMYTTGAGLLVAIILILFHSFLANQAQGLVEEIDHYSKALKRLVYLDNASVPQTDSHAQAAYTQSEEEQTHQNLEVLSSSEESRAQKRKHRTKDYEEPITDTLDTPTFAVKIE